jgi:hypothetical protein
MKPDLWLEFVPDKRHPTDPNARHQFLINGFKNAYVSDDMEPDYFEEVIEAILRYPKRIEWTPYRAILTIPARDCERFPVLCETYL